MALFTLKPVKLDEISKLKPEKISVEVSGHLKNAGMFTIKSYSTFEDLLKLLDLYEDSDVNHYSLKKVLKNDEIIVIREKSEIKKISINSATLEEFQTLKGIGEKIAERIIDYRNTNGHFAKLEDLKNVKGIGDKVFQNIEDYITL